MDDQPVGARFTVLSFVCYIPLSMILLLWKFIPTPVSDNQIKKRFFSRMEVAVCEQLTETQYDERATDCPASCKECVRMLKT